MPMGTPAQVLLALQLVGHAASPVVVVVVVVTTGPHLVVVGTDARRPPDRATAGPRGSRNRVTPSRPAGSRLRRPQRLPRPRAGFDDTRAASHLRLPHRGRPRSHRVAPDAHLGIRPAAGALGPAVSTGVQLSLNPCWRRHRSGTRDAGHALEPRSPLDRHRHGVAPGGSHDGGVHETPPTKRVKRDWGARGSYRSCSSISTRSAPRFGGGTASQRQAPGGETSV